MEPTPAFNMKKVFSLSVTGILLLVALICLPQLVETVGAKDIMVIQSPVSGTLNVFTTPGIKYQGFGKVTKYPRRDQFWFSSKADQGKKEDQGIQVRFNDGGHAMISGSLAWEMPLDDAHIIMLHKAYGSPEAIEQQLVRTVVEKSLYMTGPLMSSKESYAERRNDLIRFIDDQIRNGVYRTSAQQVNQPDPMTGAMKTVLLVQLVHAKDGVVEREDASPLDRFGVKTFNLSINQITYDPTVEKQINAQQQATMDVQTAVANAKKAEQDAITAAKNGEANAAKAKWEQEVIKAKETTLASSRLAVAELDRKTAEQNKAAAILNGEGQAEARKLVMAADGALDKKLAAIVEINKNYAEAIKGTRLTPEIVMGGGASGAAGGSAVSLIDLLMVKTAKDLATDLNVRGSGATAAPK